MIMSKLPLQSSTTYKAIWKHAGEATTQVLTLTKAEMWSVPPSNVEAVRKAADRYGVGVNQLGADWNHVFRSAPADMSVNDRQKAIMAQVKSSKATMRVTMMLPPRAAMVEYALTKDANLQAPSKEPAKISKRDVLAAAAAP